MRQLFEARGPQDHLFEKRKKLFRYGLKERVCQISGLCRFSFGQGAWYKYTYKQVKKIEYPLHVFWLLKSIYESIHALHFVGELFFRSGMQPTSLVYCLFKIHVGRATGRRYSYFHLYMCIYVILSHLLAKRNNIKTWNLEHSLP